MCVWCGGVFSFFTQIYVGDARKYTHIWMWIVDAVWLAENIFAVASAPLGEMD